MKNIECKVRVDEILSFEKKLGLLSPVYKGLDLQVDTYFKVAHGRLKLREGNIENALIHYQRADVAEAKTSTILLYTHEPNKALKEILSLHLGVQTVVRKERKIYFIDHVKFHFDTVDGLGYFIEIEVIDRNDTLLEQNMHLQLEKYFDYLGLKKENLIAQSYSDMLGASN